MTSECLNKRNRKSKIVHRKSKIVHQNGSAIKR
jgi:hypothetical protein